MKTRMGIVFSLLVLALLSGVGIVAAAQADASGTMAGSQVESTTSSGSIGPGNTLYGLRIAFENLDEAFTFSNNERLEKQVSHAEQRLSELKNELAQNNSEYAEIALDEYRNKLNQTEQFVGLMDNETGNMPGFNETGLTRAQEMLTKHQKVLGELLQRHPNNTGLAHAYNNSLQLQEKFTMKLGVRERSQQPADNSTFREPGFTGNMTPFDKGNQTLRMQDHGIGHDGNMAAPMGWNQSEDRFRSAGNSTREMPPGMNQTLRQDYQDKSNQKENQSAQNPQPPGQQQGTGGQGKSVNQNNNGNSGGNQNNNPSQNDYGNPGNTKKPSGSGNVQNPYGNQGGAGGISNNRNQQFHGR